jgi:hypothetical protein
MRRAALRMSNLLTWTVSAHRDVEENGAGARNWVDAGARNSHRSARRHRRSVSASRTYAAVEGQCIATWRPRAREHPVLDGLWSAGCVGKSRRLPSRRHVRTAPAHSLNALPHNRLEDRPDAGLAGHDPFGGHLTGSPILALRLLSQGATALVPLSAGRQHPIPTDGRPLASRLAFVPASSVPASSPRRRSVPDRPLTTGYPDMRSAQTSHSLGFYG